MVTGLGVVSPIGTGTEAFWRAVLSGSVGTCEIQRLDTSGCACKCGGEIKDFHAASQMPPRGSEALSRADHFAIVATRMALADANLVDNVHRRRTGVCFGSVLANRPALEATMRHFSRQEVAMQRQRELPELSMSRVAASEFGLDGPAVMVATACAAGNSAIGFAMDMIRAGRCRAMVAGGADELSLAMLRMFNGFRALSPDIVRPFDRNRKGLLLAEGAGALLLEDLEHALERGARIYAEVTGHGNSADAHDMTAPHPDGDGAVRSMQAAVAMSGRSVDEIDYISAHGTGTLLNDLAEARAIRRVFGAVTTPVAVSSIKAMVGHAQGAASAIEAISCVLAIRDQVLPPQVNVDDPDPECSLNLVLGASKPHAVRAVLSNAFGFGGNISCVVIERCRESAA